jgi:phosphate:Na+ symporter
MAGLSEIRPEISRMAGLCLKMWQLTYQAFMEHDLDLLAQVLKEEAGLNRMEQEITAALVGLGRASNNEAEKANIFLWADVVGDLELIGDYCKDILERVEIKIQERLLFSEEAVAEYGQLYQRTESALGEIARALEKDNLGLVREVLKEEQHIDSLVDDYRRRHNQRMLDGVCTPMSCNMFLNMLDFTAAVYYHAKKAARSLLQIKP